MSDLRFLVRQQHRRVVIHDAVVVHHQRRPERVAEVAYEHMEGTRFRHTAQFRRWRPDRTPESCTYAQLEEPVRYQLAGILRSRS